MTAGEIHDFGPIIVATGFADPLELWEALLGFYLARRPVEPTESGRLCPATTVIDVHQVAGLFAAEVQKVPRDALGRDEPVARWLAYQAELQRHTAGRYPFETYPDNERFWLDETRRLAVDLSAIAPLPTKSDVVLDAVAGAVSPWIGVKGSIDRGQAEALFEHATGEARVSEESGDVLGGIAEAADGALALGGKAARRTVGFLKEAAGGAKDVVKSAVTGVTDATITPLVDAIGKPALIGAAVVGGLLIVPKLIDRKGGKR